MILFGSCGTINHLKMARTNDIDAIKAEVFKEVDVQLKTEDLDSFERKILMGANDTLETDSIPATVDLKSALEKITHMSDYFKKWSVITGYWGIAISILYLISGIFFFYRKRFTATLAIIALVLSIIFAIAKIFIFSGDTSSAYILNVFQATFYLSIFFDIVLLVLVAVNDKTYYTEYGLEVY